MVDFVDGPDAERVVPSAADELVAARNELQRVHRALVRVVHLVAQLPLLGVTVGSQLHLNVPDADVPGRAAADHDGRLLHVREEGQRRHGGRLLESEHGLG